MTQRLADFEMQLEGCGDGLGLKAICFFVFFSSISSRLRSSFCLLLWPNIQYWTEIRSFIINYILFFANLSTSPSGCSYPLYSHMIDYFLSKLDCRHHVKYLELMGWLHGSLSVIAFTCSLNTFWLLYTHSLYFSLIFIILIYIFLPISAKCLFYIHS